MKRYIIGKQIVMKTPWLFGQYIRGNLSLKFNLLTTNREVKNETIVYQEFSKCGNLA